jgi:hypothetical protein
VTRPDFQEILADYPELLRWSHVEKITGFARRTLERRRAQGKLSSLEFVDPFGDGCLQITKASMIRFLEKKSDRTVENLMPPSLLDVRAVA